MKQKPGRSIFVSGSNSVKNQILVNGINELLGNFNKTIFPKSPVYTKQGLDDDFKRFVKELSGGDIGAIIFYHCNPIYDKNLKTILNEQPGNLELKLFIGTHPNETSEVSEFICPSNHFLESWNDANPKHGHYSLTQPVIRNLFDTKQPQDMLLKWCTANLEYKDLIKEYWKENLYASDEAYDDFAFEQFWLKCLQKGTL